MRLELRGCYATLFPWEDAFAVMEEQEEDRRAGLLA